MMNKRILQLLILLAFFATAGYAQTVGGSFMLGFPQGEFKDNVDRLGYGLSVQGTLTTPSKLVPFTIGLNVGYMIYGDESETRRLSNTLPDVLVDVDRRNSIVNFHFLMQVMAPVPGSIKPYMEGLIGGSYIFTETDVNSRNDFYKVTSDTNFDDFAWSYGGGGGFMILLSGSDVPQSPSIYLDLKARYLFGSEAEYLKEGAVDVNQDDGTVTYNVSKSKTDLFSVQIGVVAAF